MGKYKLKGEIDLAKVRTAAGAKHFHLPIGSEIIKHDYIPHERKSHLHTVKPTAKEKAQIAGKDDQVSDIEGLVDSNPWTSGAPKNYQKDYVPADGYKTLDDFPVGTTMDFPDPKEKTSPLVKNSDGTWSSLLVGGPVDHASSDIVGQYKFTNITTPDEKNSAVPETPKVNLKDTLGEPLPNNTFKLAEGSVVGKEAELQSLPTGTIIQDNNTGYYKMEKIGPDSWATQGTGKIGGYKSKILSNDVSHPLSQAKNGWIIKTMGNESGFQPVTAPTVKLKMGSAEPAFAKKFEYQPYGPGSGITSKLFEGDDIHTKSLPEQIQIANQLPVGSEIYVSHEDTIYKKLPSGNWGIQIGEEADGTGKFQINGHPSTYVFEQKGIDEPVKIDKIGESAVSVAPSTKPTADEIKNADANLKSMTDLSAIGQAAFLDDLPEGSTVYGTGKIGDVWKKYPNPVAGAPDNWVPIDKSNGSAFFNSDEMVHYQNGVSKEDLQNYGYGGEIPVPNPEGTGTINGAEGVTLYGDDSDTAILEAAPPLTRITTQESDGSEYHYVKSDHGSWVDDNQEEVNSAIVGQGVEVKLTYIPGHYSTNAASTPEKKNTITVTSTSLSQAPYTIHDGVVLDSGTSEADAKKIFFELPIGSQIHDDNGKSYTKIPATDGTNGWEWKSDSNGPPPWSGSLAQAAQDGEVTIDKVGDGKNFTKPKTKSKTAIYNPTPSAGEVAKAYYDSAGANKGYELVPPGSYVEQVKDSVFPNQKLSDRTISSIGDYVGSSSDLNGTLRKVVGKDGNEIAPTKTELANYLPSYQEHEVENLDAGMNPIAKPIVVYRGLGNSPFKIPYGASTQEANQRLDELIASKEEFWDNGYMSSSWSTDPNIVHNHGNILIINVPKGQKALFAQPHSSFGDEEQEIILPRGTHMVATKVVPRVDGRTGWMITADIVKPKKKKAVTKVGLKSNA